ncbi:MAG: thiol-disulfide oxidoreductase DCC family protein [Acidimicrobiales bacterium]
MALLVFDGDCGFCTRAAGWIERRLPAEVEVSPWQSLHLAALDLTVGDVTTAAYWVDADGRHHRGHRAVARALIAAGGLWAPVGRLIGHRAVSWLAAGVYTLVARYRHHLPGATDACRLPAPPVGSDRPSPSPPPARR